MANMINAMNMGREIQEEIAKKQQAIARQYQKILTQGQNMNKLQTFMTSGKPVGSAAYLELPPILQEIATKLTLSSLEIIIKRERNIFKKFRYKIAHFAIRKIVSSSRNKKKKDKKN